MFTVVSLITLSIVFLMSAVLLTEIDLRSSVVVALARSAKPVRLPVSHEAHNQLGDRNTAGLSHRSTRLSHSSDLTKALSFLSEYVGLADLHFRAAMVVKGCYSLDVGRTVFGPGASKRLRASGMAAR
jgi:hypothetical protein